jgi:TolB-like protein
MNATSVPAARAAQRHRLFALAFLLVVAAALWIPFPHETPPPAVSTPVLVVLPLHAAGVNARPQMLLADAVGRDLIGEFAHVDGLRVIGAVSAARAQAARFDFDQLHAQLGANRALQGSVREGDQQLLVELRLSTLPEGRTLWAQAYTEPRAQLPALERRIAAAVAEALTLKAPAAVEVAEAPALRLDYLAARQAASGGDPAAAIELLRAIVAQTPDFAPAQGLYARLLTETLRRDDSDATRDAVRAAAEAALARDANNADALMALAVIACRAQQWDACMTSFDRALAIAPEDTDCRHTYAYWLAGIGYVERALAETERGWDADPLSYDANFARGRLLDTLGRHDAAKQYLDRADPPTAGLVYARWHNALWRNDLTAAREYAAAMPQSDGFRESYIGITEAVADPSRWAQVQPMIGTSERATGRVNVLRIMLPNPDYAIEIEALERMLRNGWPSYYLLLWMPEYRALRADPAFAAFLERTQILAYWRAHGAPPRCKAADGSIRCD